MRAGAGWFAYRALIPPAALAQLLFDAAATPTPDCVSVKDSKTDRACFGLKLAEHR